MQFELQKLTLKLWQRKVQGIVVAIAEEGREDEGSQEIFKETCIKSSTPQ